MKLDPLNGEQPARGDGLIDCMAIVGWSYPPYPGPARAILLPAARSSDRSGAVRRGDCVRGRQRSVREVR